MQHCSGRSLEIINYNFFRNQSKNSKTSNTRMKKCFEKLLPVVFNSVPPFTQIQLRKFPFHVLVMLSGITLIKHYDKSKTAEIISQLNFQ